MYDQNAYDRFARELKHLIKGPNIKPVSLKWLKKQAGITATKTKNGSWGWRSAVSSRIGPKTVYLGEEQVRLPKPSELHKDIISKAPQQLEKVIHLLRTLPFYLIRRRMGENDIFNPFCNLLVSAACLKNYRLGYMWSNTVFKPDKRPGPEFFMVHIPEEHQLRQQVLAMPQHNINIAMGSDYMGEDKKGFLRQAMWRADQMGMVGLHAGTKIVMARDIKTGQIKKYGVFLFGLSATGKSTWSCHQLGLNWDDGERTEVIQDDIVFLRKDGSALGSENGFFVKTDVHQDQQEAMYYALSHKTALLENVMINAKGEVDFLDESLCGNGRSVIRRKELKIKRNNRLMPIYSSSINLPPLEELDGLVFAFITRRNTIMSFAQELNPQQAVLAYLWGESSHSYASNPAKAGESVRTVGTDPFIVGSRAVKVNRFYDIIMDLYERFPDKVKFMQYNTGGIGEIINIFQDGEKRVKKLVRKVERVPLSLMSAIQRGDLRGTNTYTRGMLGTRDIVQCEGKSMSEYSSQNYYSQEQIDQYIVDLVEGRRKYTQEIASEGLRQEVIQAAEKSFVISDKVSKGILTSKASQDEPEPEQHKPVPGRLSSIARPKRGSGWRYG